MPFWIVRELDTNDRTLVLDASAALGVATTRDGFTVLATFDLVAPPLMWSEALSALRETAWRGDISRSLAPAVRDRLFDAPVRRHSSNELYAEAWRISEQLGWAKTYDAEYVALARLLGCPLLTLDQKLRRGAERLVPIVVATDL